MTHPAPPREPRLGTLHRIHRLIRSNWISTLGAALMTLAALGFITLVPMHSLGGAWSGPYTGLLAALVVPAVFAVGLILVPVGLLIYRRELRSRVAAMGDRPMYLARAVGILTILNLGAVATAGYAGTTYLNSNNFCGTACHEAMEPEYQAYLRSPHQRVDCVACHVEPGAKGFVTAKLNGTRQLWHYLQDDYQRPIPTPIHNLIDASETCETCHWPEKYLGTKLLVKPHFRIDEKVSSYTNVVLLRTGGTRADGESVGIHWHVHPDSVVEYVATDDRRAVIPWVRMTRPDGTHDVYAAPGYDHDVPPEGELRRMDCNDCHNRSAHAFELPDEALDEALTVGLIPRDLPFVKKHALEALHSYWTRENAAEGIRTHLQRAYAETGDFDEPTRVKVEQAVAAVTEIWLRNVYPDRGLDWNTYPDLSGHIGCFRCHDGQHVNKEGKAIFGPKAPTATAADAERGACSQCHVVLSENSEDPAILDALGLGK